MRALVERFLLLLCCLLGLVTAHSVSASINCPLVAGHDDQEPVLLTECTDLCGYTGFCVYYPYKDREECAEIGGSRCLKGDTCTFECLGGDATSIEFYRTWDDVTEVLNGGYNGSKALVNASLIKRWDGDALPMDGLRFQSLGTAEFVLPEFFVKSQLSATHIALEHIQCPTFSTPSKPLALTSLNLTNCGLIEFPWSPANVPNLQHLQYTHNRFLKSFELPTTLKTLNLTDTAVTSVLPTIQKMTSLSDLVLDHNPLKTISAKAFPSSLSSLSLRNCSLSALPTDFKAMSALRSLDISSNEIGPNFDQSQLPPSLVALRMASCGLRRAPTGFVNSSELRIIDLSDSSIPVEEIALLPKSLNSLSLRTNHYTQVPTAIAKRFMGLLELDLSNNPIANLATGQLPESLERLQLNGTTISTIPNDVLGARLKDLTLTHSQLRELPKRLITASGTSLDVVNLSHNNISSYEPIYASQVYLSYNSIQSINNQSFDRITTLDLSYNRLESFQPLKIAQLRVLSLRGNNLTTVPQELAQADSLDIIDLRENPIRDFMPTPQMLSLIRRASVVRMDQEQLRSECLSIIRLKSLLICDPLAVRGIDGAIGNIPSSESPSPPPAVDSDTSTSYLLMIFVIMTVVLALLVVGGVILVRRWKKQDKMVIKDDSFSLSVIVKPADETLPWEDTELMDHRLDANLVLVDNLLATGTFGEVFLASYQQQQVVLKRLKKQDSSRQEILQFVSEVRLMASFQFERIVRFVGVVWTNDKDLAVVTEYMVNGDLRTYLDNQPEGSAHEGWTIQKLRVALDMAEALMYLHSRSQPLIHRDLKSCNVLLDHEMRACLSDFGTTRPVADDSMMTAEVGTALWMAPEVLTGRRYDQSADVYSLGVILNELDRHTLPFQEDEPAWTASHRTMLSSFVMGRVVMGSLRVSFLPSCPPHIVELGMRCTELDPSERPSTMEVAYELRSLLYHEMQAPESRLDLTVFGAFH
ncbi:hypothetical protein Poli38472_010891 [Pythium oligandrum]|uniref:Protein kinase domain-containing protein n=1 Tax=Pythium oligandrum TaxID=41045 RepID=A0A8K1FKL1_PYTOL|nr:hypothetical protein Poli38472_010891 [Pythium oligandrum]|eukprot:TMW61828.1 hypothetical protein Poli38472_010891 [Pythium oligandrum]